MSHYFQRPPPKEDPPTPFEIEEWRAKNAPSNADELKGEILLENIIIWWYEDQKMEHDPVVAAQAIAHHRQNVITWTDALHRRETRMAINAIRLSRGHEAIDAEAE